LLELLMEIDAGHGDDSSEHCFCFPGTGDPVGADFL